MWKLSHFRVDVKANVITSLPIFIFQVCAYSVSHAFIRLPYNCNDVTEIVTLMRLIESVRWGNSPKLTASGCRSKNWWRWNLTSRRDRSDELLSVMICQYVSQTCQFSCVHFLWSPERLTYYPSSNKGEAVINTVRVHYANCKHRYNHRSALTVAAGKILFSVFRMNGRMVKVNQLYPEFTLPSLRCGIIALCITVAEV